MYQREVDEGVIIRNIYLVFIYSSLQRAFPTLGISSVIMVRGEPSAIHNKPLSSLPESMLN